MGIQSGPFVSLGVKFSVKPTEMGTGELPFSTILAETIFKLSKCFEIKIITANRALVMAAGCALKFKNRSLSGIHVAAKNDI
jgi:hypothetical protein